MFIDRNLNIQATQNLFETIKQNYSLMTEYDFKYQMGKIRFSTSDSFREGSSLVGVIDVVAKENQIQIAITAELKHERGFKTLSQNWIATVNPLKAVNFILNSLEEAKVEAQVISESLEGRGLNVPLARRKLSSLKLRLATLKH